MTVLDEAGRPLSGVRIDHTEATFGQYVTNDQGQTTLTTTAIAAVVRKVGYRSEFIRLPEQGGIQVTLRPESPRPFSACPGQSVVNLSRVAMRMPASREVVHSKKFLLDTTWLHWYRLKKQKDGADIGYSIGGLAGDGFPNSSDLWRVTHYAEVTLAFKDELFTDARFEDELGKHWRIIGRRSEAITYQGVDTATAEVFDKFLDGVCLASVN